MSEMVKKCQSVFFPKAQDGVLRGLVLSTTQKYGHRGVKELENILIESENLYFFS